MVAAAIGNGAPARENPPDRNQPGFERVPGMTRTVGTSAKTWGVREESAFGFSPLLQCPVAQLRVGAANTKPLLTNVLKSPEIDPLAATRA
jgi:hypothetical protein